MTRRPTPVTATSIATGISTNYRSISEAGEKGGFCKATITLCIRGIVPTHAGFRFTTSAKLDPPRRPELAAKVKELRAEGMSYAKIGKALGVAESTAYYHARNKS
ncbi:hypothetical protein Ahp2_63 [Aeromonas phage Ahp2]|nr:hypothetical protein Ahp2_63 [Aeromonas phage Ahp2]